MVILSEGQGKTCLSYTPPSVLFLWYPDISLYLSYLLARFHHFPICVFQHIAHTITHIHNCLMFVIVHNNAHTIGTPRTQQK